MNGQRTECLFRSGCISRTRTGTPSTGPSHGTDRWAQHSVGPLGTKLWRHEIEHVHPPQPDSIVPNDWNYKRMFAADDGIIYAVQGPAEAVNGRLYWYRHRGRGDGSDC